MTTKSIFAMLPRDGLFCKDGRGWFTTAAERGRALDWPWPSTVLGSVRTMWGRREEQRKGTQLDPQGWRSETAGVALGCTLALRRPVGDSWGPEHLVWPWPADAICGDSGGIACLDPTPVELPLLGRDEDPARESLWLRSTVQLEGKVAPPPRWCPNDWFIQWLTRKCLAGSHDSDLRMQRRTQTHVAIDPVAGTAIEGKIFSHEILETLEWRRESSSFFEWALAIEMIAPSEVALAIATLGSDSRLATLEMLPADIFQAPPEIDTAFAAGSRGLRLFVVTPTIFDGGWLPDGFEASNELYRGSLPIVGADVILRAAFVGRPLSISGWDMAAREPKETVRAVPPGSVYFFERVDGAAFREGEARALWLSAVGRRTEEGFGRVVPGIWAPQPR